MLPLILFLCPLLLLCAVIAALSPLDYVHIQLNTVNTVCIVGKCNPACIIIKISI